MDKPQFKSFKDYLNALVDSTLSDEDKKKKKSKKDRTADLPTGILKYLRNTTIAQE